MTPRIRTVLFCVLVAAAAGCKDDRGELAVERAEVAHSSADLAKAATDFELARRQYVDMLRMQHDVFSVQTAVAHSMVADPALAEVDRQEATDKVLTFERELNEAEQAIDAVATATMGQWDAVRVTARDAFTQLETAHDEAFDALTKDRLILR